MRALLVINQGGDRDIKLIVRLHTKELVMGVNRLVAESREREAFRLICLEGQVEAFIPPGQKITFKPEFTFIEDAL